MKTPKFQKENLNATMEVVKFLNNGPANITRCQEVMWDNKPHLNGTCRRWPQPWHAYGVTCPRGRGLKQNYDNIWKYLLGKGLIKIEDNPRDRREKLVTLI